MLKERAALHASQTREGQVVGRMPNLFRKRLPRVQFRFRAGLDWIAHFLFSTVTLFLGVVSSLKHFFFFFLLYLDRYPVPHVTGLGGFPCWFLEPALPLGEGECSHSHMALGHFLG